MIARHSQKLLFLFVAAGLILSLWSLKNHYAISSSSSCNVNETFNCDIVNRGEHSEFLGFPVAGIGVLGYVIIGIVAWFYYKEPDKTMKSALLFLGAGGLAFSLYLTYLEAFVIYAWCLLCLGSLSSIFGITASSMLLKPQTMEEIHVRNGGEDREDVATDASQQ